MRGKRSRARKRSFFYRQKRLIAFMMAMVMTFTNISANWNVAYAGAAEEVEFEITGSNLLLSLKEAVAGGNVVSEENLDFTNGPVDKFHELFFGSGVVYELFPEITGSGMDAELRVFARLPEEADDAYTVTGDEEIIMMYINNSDVTLNCQTRVDDKSLKQVTVKSFENVFGDDEIEIISKPSEEIVIDTSENGGNLSDDGDTQNSTAADGNQDGNDGTQVGDGHDSVVEIEDTTTAGTDATGDKETSEDKSEGSTEESATLPEDNAGEVKTEETKTEETQPAGSQPKETQSKETEAPESQEKAEEPEIQAEPVASISVNYAPRVAEPSEEAGGAEEKPEPADLPHASADDTGTKTDEPSIEEPKETEGAAADSTPKETLPPQEALPPVDNGDTGENGAGTPTNPAVPETPKETEPSAPEIPKETEPLAPETPKETEPSAPEVPKETEPSTPEVPKETEPSVPQSPEGTEPSTPETPEETVPQIPEETQPVPGTPDVATGSEAVQPEETVKAETAGEHDLVGMGNCSTAKIYSMSLKDVLKKSYPKFRYTETIDNGVKVTLRANAGVLPSGTTAEIVDVTDNVKDAVTESSEGNISDIVACDITLKDADGNVLDNDSWIGYVQVTFSGSPVKEVTQGSETIAVMCINTDVDTTSEVLAPADVNNLELVNEITPDHTEGVNQVNFDAEHFTTYFATGVSDWNWMYTLSVKQILTDPATNNRYVQWDEVLLKSSNFVNNQFSYADYTLDALKNPGVKQTTADSLVIQKDVFGRNRNAEVEINYLLQDGYYVYRGSDGTGKTVNMDWIEGERVQAVADETYPIYINAQQYADLKSKTNAHPAEYAGTCGQIPGFFPKERHMHYIPTRYDANAWVISYVRCDKYGGESEDYKYFRVIFEDEAGEMLKEMSVKENDRPVPPSGIEDLEGWYLRSDLSKKILDPLPQITNKYAEEHSEVYPGGAKAVVFVAKTTPKPDTGIYKIDVDKDIIKVVIADGTEYEGHDAEDKVEKARGGVTAGDTITYRVVIKNEGNRPLTRISVTDKIMNSGTLIDLGKFAKIDRIEPRKSVAFTYEYTIQAEDVKEYDHELELENRVEAVASEQDKHGNPVKDSDSEDIDLIKIVVKPVLGIEKKVSNTTPKPGERITYTITVTNRGDGAAKDIKVTDTVPEGLGNISTSPKADKITGRTYTWNIKNLEPNGSRVFKVYATVDTKAEPGTQISNTAYIDEAHSSTETITVTGSRLGITKTASEKTVKPGQTFNYVVKIENTGNAPAKDVMVEDRLSDHLEFIKAEPQAGSIRGNNIKWKIDQVDAKEVKEIVITVKVKDNVEPETKIYNTATLNGCQNSNKEVVEVIGNKVKITKKANVKDNKVVAGQEFTYTLTIQNLGSKPAKDVIVTDKLVPELEFVKSSPAPYKSDEDINQYQWKIDNIKACGKAEITITVKVKDAAAPGTIISNTALADGKTSNESLVTVTGSILEITKKASQKAVKPGDGFHYTLTVKNTGNATAKDIKVTDVLPEELEFISSLPYQETENQGQYEWSIKSIKAGCDVSIRVYVKVKESVAPGTEIFNTAKAGDIPSNEEKVTVMDSNLVITKSVDKTDPRPGDKVVYTLTITNTGNKMSGPSIVEDRLSDYLEFVRQESSWTSSLGWDNTYRWVLPHLNPDGEITITITAKVKEDTPAGTVIENIGTVNGKESNPVEITVTGPSLGIVKTADDQTPVKGGFVTYTLKVTNNGNASAQDVKVEDRLPMGLEFVTEGSTPGCTVLDNGKLQWTIDELEAEKDKDIIIVTKVTAEAGNQLSNIGYVDDIPSVPEVVVVGELSYTVKFYTDSTSDGNHIAGADRVIEDATLGMAIDELAVDTTLDTDKVPDGYKAEGIIDLSNSIDKIGDDSDKNIIRVYLPRRTDLSYTVNYYKDAVDGSLIAGDGNFLGSDVFADQEYLKVITGQDIDRTKYAPYGYTDEGRVEPESITITTNVEENVINVIFDKDSEKTKEVSYRVEHYLGNETSPRDAQTVTVKVWLDDPGVIPVTADSLKPNTYAGYTFKGYEPAGIKAGDIMEDGAVIKLMYTADNTPGGGGSGGGGGSSSGGGSGRYGTTTGGPGMTAIPEQEVPLAEAPELAALIDDGEIPLAGLPKTGQETARTELTLVLSGIFLVMTAVSRKRRDEA